MVSNIWKHRWKTSESCFHGDTGSNFSETTANVSLALDETDFSKLIHFKTRDSDIRRVKYFYCGSVTGSRSLVHFLFLDQLFNISADC